LKLRWITSSSWLGYCCQGRAVGFVNFFAPQ
jgi:hypothetical protein